LDQETSQHQHRNNQAKDSASGRLVHSFPISKSCL
jgi:hypothetical protein